MNSEQWQQVEHVFDAALHCETDRRAAFLDHACESQEWLRKEVESLLLAHQQADHFIQNPIIAGAVQNLIAKHKELRPGQQLGKYHLLEQLGAGGMGEVYLAEDTTLRRKVALKLLPPLFANDPERVRRLELEACAASALNHPNILTIHEIGETDSIHYIVTEYIDGPTLRQRTANQPLSVHDSIEVTKQIASALAAAHAAGIVHHDIKPENIMVRPNGLVKVVDFGIAKQHEQSPQLGRVSSNDIDSGVMGTIKYVSPEQAQGKKVDARSDIWSLGVVLYEMLSGQVPFAGANDKEILNSIIAEQPKPLQVPAQLQHIIDRALSKSCAERYQIVEELLADLNGIESEEKKPWFRFLVVGLVAILLVTMLVVAVRPWQRDAKDVGFNGEIDRMIRLTTSGNIVTAAISPDGDYLAYVAADGADQSLRTLSLDRNRTNDRLLFQSDALEYVGLSFSPDGKYIYSVVRENGGPRGSLYRVPAAGGTPENLPVGDIETPVTFSPDGKSMAFVSRDSNGDQSLTLSSVDGANSRRLAGRKYPEFFLYPAWSPDGTHIACVTGSYFDGFFMTLVTVSVADGIEGSLTTNRWWSIPQIAWRPDGHGLFLIAIDQATRTSSYLAHIAYPSGEVQKITNDLNDYRELRVMPTRNALIVVQSTQTSDLWVTSLNDGPRAVPITHTKYDQISGMAWMPDGRVVYALRRAGENWSIWSIKADGSAHVQLTGTSGNDLYPTVSPDGRFIVFTSSRSGSNNLWRMDSDGRNLLQLTHGLSEWWPSVSVDGGWVIYTSFATNQPTLWKISINGGSPVQITPHFSILPVVSPSEDLIACYSWDGQSQFELQITIMKLDGTVVKTFAAPGSKFQKLDWIFAGQALAYIQEREGKSNIWTQSLADGPAKPLTSFTTQRIFDFAVSPSGRNIAMSRGSITNDLVFIEFR